MFIRPIAFLLVGASELLQEDDVSSEAEEPLSSPSQVPRVPHGVTVTSSVPSISANSAKTETI